MISDDFCLNNTFEEKVLKTMTNIESSKAAEEDRLSGRLLQLASTYYQNQFLNSAISQSHRETFQMLASCKTEAYF